MNFKRITMIDPCELRGEYRERIFSFSEKTPYIYDTLPKDNSEIINRIGDSDCVLVSWNTRIDAEVLRACSSIRYIGMCCSLYDEKSANVDMGEARKLGIIVKGVRDYGDNGTVEFIFARLIMLCQGMGGLQWKSEQVELSGKTIGIIGMGVLGEMVARAALQFGMKVIYYSRTRKEKLELEGISYRELSDLLPSSDVITTHLPRNTRILGEDEIRQFKKDAIYINTSLGEPYHKEALLDWLSQDSGNFALFDITGSGGHSEEFKSFPNIVLFEKPSGFTAEAKVRLTEKVWGNMDAFLQSNPLLA